MKMITAELIRQLKSAAQEEIMCREVSDTSDAWQDLASPENILALVEIALPVLYQQGGWIFEQCENEPCANGAIVNVHGAGIHLCADCSRDKKYSRMKITALPKRLSLSPQPQPSTNPQIDNDGSIEWRGGECPVENGALVEFELRDGDKATALSTVLDWTHENRSDDIIAYRVVENDGRSG